MAPSPPEPATPAWPRRADAARNRQRLLQAADEVFAAQGAAAPTEAIARHAGVGIGTLFRHFPTKEALLEAVLAARLSLLACYGQSLATANAPGDALFSLLRRAVEDAPGKLALADALATAGVDVGPALVEPRQRLREVMGMLLSRAQRSGDVRTDIGVDEVFALLVGASRMAEYAGSNRAVLDRAVAVVLDGLRAKRRAGRPRK